MIIFHLATSANHKYTNSFFFPQFFHLFVTINSKFAITSQCVIYSSFPFKTSPVGDYSLEPEKPWRWGRGWGVWVACLKAKDRFVGGGGGRAAGSGTTSQSHFCVKRCFSFFFFLFHKLRFFFSFSWSWLFSPLALSGLLLFTPPPLLPLLAHHPLAKQRTCWLSWTSK